MTTVTTLTATEEAEFSGTAATAAARTGEHEPRRVSFAATSEARVYSQILSKSAADYSSDPQDWGLTLSFDLLRIETSQLNDTMRGDTTASKTAADSHVDATSNQRSRPQDRQPPIWSLLEKIILSEEERITFDEANDPGFVAPGRPFTMVGTGDLILKRTEPPTGPVLSEEDKALEEEMRRVLRSMT